jgi:hypothetical protein
MWLSLSLRPEANRATRRQAAPPIHKAHLLVATSSCPSFHPNSQHDFTSLYFNKVASTLKPLLQLPSSVALLCESRLPLELAFHSPAASSTDKERAPSAIGHASHRLRCFQTLQATPHHPPFSNLLQIEYLAQVLHVSTFFDRHSLATSSLHFTTQSLPASSKREI